MYKVLVVDDDLPIVEYFKSYNWAGLGCELVATAINGRAGYEKYIEYKPDIVITDIVMPICDGIEFSKQIREHSSSTQIIFLTSYEDFEYARKAIQFGVSSYLLKGLFTDEELVGAITLCISKLDKMNSVSYPAFGTSGERIEILRAIDYINEHYKEDLMLETLSSTLGFSPNYFGSMFKKYTGMGFREYLNKVRMEKAYKLLINTNLKIYEIATEVGIPNYRYFISVFQKHFGITPKQVRGGSNIYNNEVNVNEGL